MKNKMKNKMKDRLVYLLTNLPKRKIVMYGQRVGRVAHNSNSIAEHLLANGVLVPPCKVGDTVYVIIKPIFRGDPPQFIKEETVEGLCYFKGKWYAVQDGEDFEIDDMLCFLTREEAEKALKE